MDPGLVEGLLNYGVFHQFTKPTGYLIVICWRHARVFARHLGVRVFYPILMVFFQHESTVIRRKLDSEADFFFM
jgi:hypothetical protein